MGIIIHMKNMKTFAFIVLTILISCSLSIKTRSKKLHKMHKKQVPKKTTTEKAPVTNSTNTTTTEPASNTTTKSNTTAPAYNTTEAKNSTMTNATEAFNKKILARDALKNKTLIDRAADKMKETLDIFGRKTTSSAFAKFSYFVMFVLTAMML